MHISAHDSFFFLCYLYFMEMIPNFIVFEGGDGSGTTTQVSLLENRIKSLKKNAFYATFEPTDGYIGRLIRSVLKKEILVKPQTLAHLFAADRNEHLFGENGIIERVNRGELVVSDRYVLSSLVYQGIECGDELPNTLNSPFPAPEITFFLDIDPQVALSRVQGRSTLEIYEYSDFQEKVRKKYLTQIDIYRSAGIRVEIIDASKSADEVAEQVWSILSLLPIIKA